MKDHCCACKGCGLCVHSDLPTFCDKHLGSKTFKDAVDEWIAGGGKMVGPQWQQAQTLTFPRKIASYGHNLVISIPKELVDIVNKDCIYKVTIERL